MQGTDITNELSSVLRGYAKTQYNEMYKIVSEAYSKYYDVNDPEYSKKIDEEVLANILGENLGTQQFINRLVNEKPTLARRIYYWVVDKLAKLDKSHKNERLYWANVKNKYIQAYGQEYAGETGKAFSIEKNAKGYYVQLNESILTGEDPQEWGKQLTDYINSVIRKDGDFKLITSDGDQLVITKDSSVKLADRRRSDNINELLSEDEYKNQLDIAAQMNEVGEVSKYERYRRNNKDRHMSMTDVEKFEYRTAFVRNADGNYYKVNFSTAVSPQNGNVIYSIGNIKGAAFPGNGSKARRYSASGEWLSNNNNISQNNKTVNNILSNKKSGDTKYSISLAQDNEYLSAVEKGDTSTAQSTENNTFKLGNRYASIKQEPNYDDLSKYQVIGIRTVPYEQSGKYKIGDYVDDSYDWDSENGDVSAYYTSGKSLNGASAIGIDSNYITDKASLIESIQGGFKQSNAIYPGAETYIIGGEYEAYGNDTNEVIIRNAKVIGELQLYNSRNEAGNDIRHSIDNDELDNYLKQHYSPKGTGQTIQQLKAAAVFSSPKPDMGKLSSLVGKSINRTLSANKAASEYVRIKGFDKNATIYDSWQRT